MARTGVDIQMKNTTLGAPNDPNATALLSIDLDKPTITSQSYYDATAPRAYFNDSVPLQLIRGKGELPQIGFPESRPAGLENALKNVYDFFDINPNGFLWLGAGCVDLDIGGDISELDRIVTSQIARMTDHIDHILQQDFSLRPRQIGCIWYLAMFDDWLSLYNSTPEYLASADTFLTALHNWVLGEHDRGMRFTFISNFFPPYTSQVPSINAGLAELYPKKLDYPFISLVTTSSDVDFVESPFGTSTTSDVARVLAILTKTSVGTSIGEVLDANNLVQAGLFFAGTIDNPSVKGENVTSVSTSGSKQCIFARTRYPKNGIYFNDGSTMAAPDTALSTLEATRTLCDFADNLQDFFTGYLNTRVPVNSLGQMQTAYKQTVLAAAQAKVAQPYIDNGDISDARITLQAKGGNFIESREWEVSYEILPASTLRWVSGSVFYVKSLN